MEMQDHELGDRIVITAHSVNPGQTSITIEDDAHGHMEIVLKNEDARTFADNLKHLT